MSGEVFYGRRDGRTADKTRRKNFVLGSPHFKRVSFQVHPFFVLLGFCLLRIFHQNLEFFYVNRKIFWRKDCQHLEKITATIFKKGTFKWKKQHRQTVTVHSPIYWGTTRLPFIRPPELERLYMSPIHHMKTGSNVGGRITQVPAPITFITSLVLW